MMMSHFYQTWKVRDLLGSFYSMPGVINKMLRMNLPDPLDEASIEGDAMACNGVSY